MSKKYYVVWRGWKPGIYDTWERCQSQVYGYKNAKFKAFPTWEAAEEAFRKGPEEPSAEKEIDRSWKPDSEYPEDVQKVLKRIRHKSP